MDQIDERVCVKCRKINRLACCISHEVYLEPKWLRWTYTVSVTIVPVRLGIVETSVSWAFWVRGHWAYIGTPALSPRRRAGVRAEPSESKDIELTLGHLRYRLVGEPGSGARPAKKINPGNKISEIYSEKIFFERSSIQSRQKITPRNKISEKYSEKIFFERPSTQSRVQ